MDSLNFSWRAQIEAICAGANWSKEIRKLHINVKELIVVLYRIRSLKEKLKGKKICIRVDNKVVMSYLNRMTGRMKHFAEIIRVIHSEVIEMGSSLHAIYIASKKNDVANTISRTKKYHN
jgi:hypothetical protein